MQTWGRAWNYTVLRQPAEMARPIRIEFAGALYHVTSRGDRREPIYEDDADRACFLKVPGQVAGISTGCVMRGA